MTTDNACETPMDDRVAAAVELMQRGARMRLDAIPGDSSMSSSMFGPDVTAEIAKRLTTPEAKSEVAITDEHIQRFVEALCAEDIGDPLRASGPILETLAKRVLSYTFPSALVDPEGGV